MGRNKKRLIGIGFVLFCLIFVIISNFFQERYAKGNGFKNYQEYLNDRKVKTNIEDFKTIYFYGDETISEDSPIIQNLKDDGFEVKCMTTDYATYTKGNLITSILNDNIKIVNGCIMYDYLLNVLTGNETNNTEKLIEDYVSSFDKNTIVITSPNVIFNNIENKDDISYEKYMQVLTNSCKKYNIKYIDLYNFTLEKPLVYSEDGLEEFDESINNFINENLEKELEEIVENYEVEQKNAYK